MTTRRRTGRLGCSSGSWRETRAARCSARRPLTAAPRRSPRSCATSARERANRASTSTWSGPASPTRWAPTAISTRPGVITSFGPATDGPVDTLIFAGDGYAPAWPGYMEGAIRSGQRAAKEALAGL